MRGLCGWFAIKDTDAADDLARQMVSALRGASADVRVHTAPRAAVAACGLSDSMRLVADDGLLLACAGHPWRRDSREATPLAPLDIAQALRAQGTAALHGIGGDFALAAYDTRSQKGWLAIDRIGAHRLVVADTGHGMAFGSSLDMIAAYPGLARTVSDQALFDYLYFHVVPGPQTIYSGWQRLMPGQCIEFGPGATAPSPRPYWQMAFTEGREQPLEQRSSDFKRLLEQCVARAADAPDCGSFLSGGTDSSTVTGMLGRASGAPPRSFSIGFDVQGYDETGYARIAARHYGCEHHEYFVTPAEVVEAVPRIATSYDQPFGNSSAIPTYYCAKVAGEHGIRRLLAGDGGDELFGGNERYGKQHLLSLYHRLPRALRAAVLEPLFADAAWVKPVMPLRKLGSYIEQARPPMPLRYESYNLLQHLGIAQVFDPDFLARVDPGRPRQLLIEAHAPFADASLINQMLGIDLRFILADGDLPKVTHMCNLAGVDVTFPLLDDRLVEFSRELPSPLKLKGTQLRWFFKQALNDFLPPEIITKQKHGFGLPVGHWLLSHEPLRRLAADAIDLLRPRGIVKPGFVDELMRDRLSQHPGYYGTMVWILMMLGLWLDSRRL